MRARSNSYCVCTFSRSWSLFTLLRTRSVLQPDTVCSCRKLANDDTATELPQTGIFPQTPIASDALTQPYTPACHPSGSETGGATSQPQSRGHRHRPAGHPASTSRVKQELLVLGAHGCLLLEDSLTASACTGAVHSAYMQYIFCTKQQRTPCGRSSDTYAVQQPELCSTAIECAKHQYQLCLMALLDMVSVHGAESLYKTHDDIHVCH